MNPFFQSVAARSFKASAHSRKRLDPTRLSTFSSPIYRQYNCSKLYDLRRRNPCLRPSEGSSWKPAAKLLHSHRLHRGIGHVQVLPSPILQIKESYFTEKGDAGDETANETLSSDNAADKRPVLFPWRHESTPPARVLEQIDFSGMPNNCRARFVRKLIAARELNISFWEVLPFPFYTHEWENELASNFSMAFGLALQELLCSLFQGMFFLY